MLTLEEVPTNQLTQIGDPTAAGNTCDDDDPAGCIFTQNLLVDDATADEISAAVAGVSSSNAAASSNSDSSTAGNSCAVTTVTAAANAPAATNTGTGEANVAATSSGS